MKNETPPIFNWPADVNRLIAAKAGRPHFQRVTELVQVDLVGAPIDDDAHRGGFVMLAHHNDAMAKTGVFHMRAGNQQLPLKGGR